MNNDAIFIADSLSRLKTYCEAEDYKGWDPYDGLNSRLFKAIPLAGRSAICRLVWIQLFKRCPFNLRRIALVPKQHNAKGIGLFIEGYLRLHDAVVAQPQLAARFGSPDELRGRIERLGELLLGMRTPGFSGSAWGYNFPWQCRREFLFPAGEPTVVATNFCATALLEASALTGRDDFRQAALDAAGFVMNDLRRTPHAGGVILSYSRMPGNDTIYNASLLGSRLLSYCYSAGGATDDSLRELARASVAACCADQRADGSWTYGVKPVTGWIDSFHTGYNLDGIAAYMRLTGDHSFDSNLERGLDYYLRTFFDPQTGAVKYYHDRTYPVDIHCPGQLPMTLSRTGRYGEHRGLVHAVLRRAVDTMQAPDGYFYYQLKNGISSRISYMRWSNAFMFAALATALAEETKDNESDQTD